MNKIDAEKIFDNLAELSDGQAIVFTYPSYKTALVGIGQVSEQAGKQKYYAVYDYELMIEFVVKDFKICRQDAIEYIDYNTLGTSVVNNPIILYRS